MGRIGRGLRLIRVSLGVVRQEPALFLLPLLSLVLVTLIAAAAWFGESAASALQLGDTAAGFLVSYGIVAVAVFAGTIVVAYFNAAVVAGAGAVLQGRRQSLSASLAQAAGLRWRLVRWALLSAVVSVFIRSAATRGFIGRVIASFSGVAWGLLTFLVVPVMLWEGRRPLAAIERSAELYQQRWGEEMTGAGALNLAFFLLASPVFFAAAFVFILNATMGIAFFVVAIIVCMVAGSALSATFTAALYGYAINALPLGTLMGAGYAPRPAGGAYPGYLN